MYISMTLPRKCRRRYAKYFWPEVVLLGMQHQMVEDRLRGLVDCSLLAREGCIGLGSLKRDSTNQLLSRI
jgi:hypothetical protein